VKKVCTASLVLVEGLLRLGKHRSVRDITYNDIASF